jgi:hypothetical protein
MSCTSDSKHSLIKNMFNKIYGKINYAFMLFNAHIMSLKVYHYGRFSLGIVQCLDKKYDISESASAHFVSIPM